MNIMAVREVIKKMTTLLHGTAIESALAILKAGAFESSDQVWDASVPGKTYFRIMDQDNPEEAVRQAIDNAQIAAAYRNSKYESVGIIVLEMDNEIFEDNFMDDYSAPNMNDCVEIDTNVLNKLIAEKTIKMSVKECLDAYEPLMRVWYMYGLNPQYFSYPDANVERICEAMNNTNIDISWIYDALDGYCTDLESMRDMDPEKEFVTTINLMDAIEITGAKNDVLVLDIPSKNGGYRFFTNMTALKADPYLELEKIRVSKINVNSDMAYATFAYMLEDIPQETIKRMLDKYGHTCRNAE